MKAHQRIIREKKATEKSMDLFGDWWADIDTDIKKAEVRQTDRATAEKIILEYEWLGTMHRRSSVFFGIFWGDYCGGVTCCGPTDSPTHQYQKYIGSEHCKRGIQIHRGACVHWAHKHAGSMLIASTLKRLGIMGHRWALAFSDSNAGEVGTLYQATNWYYLGQAGETPPDIVCKKTGKILISHHKISKVLPGRSEKYLKQYEKEHPSIEVKRNNPKGRYFALMGSKKDKKAMMKHLKPHIKPYPKRR